MTDTLDQAVEAGRVVGVDTFALQQFGVAQGFAAGVLGEKPAPRSVMSDLRSIVVPMV